MRVIVLNDVTMDYDVSGPRRWLDSWDGSAMKHLLLLLVTKWVFFLERDKGSGTGWLCEIENCNSCWIKPTVWPTGSERKYQTIGKELCSQYQTYPMQVEASGECGYSGFDHTFSWLTQVWQGAMHHSVSRQHSCVEYTRPLTYPQRVISSDQLRGIHYHI